MRNLAHLLVFVSWKMFVKIETGQFRFSVWVQVVRSAYIWVGSYDPLVNILFLFYLYFIFFKIWFWFYFVGFLLSFMLILISMLSLYGFTCYLLINFVFLIIAENKKGKKQGGFYFVEIFTLWGMNYFDILFLNVLFLMIW